MDWKFGRVGDGDVLVWKVRRSVRDDYVDCIFDLCGIGSWWRLSWWVWWCGIIDDFV